MTNVVLHLTSEIHQLHSKLHKSRPIITLVLQIQYRLAINPNGRHMQTILITLLG